MRKIKFLKGYNNNVALVKDQAGIEWIVVGKGVAFQKKYGDSINEEVIRRKFISENIDNRLSVSDILENVSIEEHQMTVDIVQLAKEHLNFEFSTTNYLLLAEHIHYAILRTTNEDSLFDGYWEITKLYPKEFAVSKLVIQYLESNYNIVLMDSELSYLTLHFVSAKNNWVSVSETMDMTKMIKKILEIIQYHFYEKIDITTASYSRFITHLRYFFLRYHENDSKEYPLNKDIIQMVIMKYPKSYAICEKIAEYLKEEKGWILSEEEMVYLTFHMIRLMNRED